MTASVDDVAAMVLFARVVEERSFTGAATRLGLSKSVVSAQVARFEERLGTRLLHRTTRRLSLTEAGLELYQRCARIAAEADEAAAMAEGLGPTPHGTLKVNAPTIFGSRLLAPAMGEFLDANPKVKVELVVEDRFIDVVHGGYDVVVRIAMKGQLRTEANVTARKVGADRLIACASRDYLARRGRPESPMDLVGHHCLRYIHKSMHEEWRFREESGKDAFVPVPSAFSSSSGEALRAATLSGLGLAVVPAFYVADALEDGRLEQVLPRVSWGELGVFLLFPGREHVPARVRAFVDWFAAWVKRNGLRPVVVE